MGNNKNEVKSNTISANPKKMFENPKVEFATDDEKQKFLKSDFSKHSKLLIDTLWSK